VAINSKRNNCFGPDSIGQNKVSDKTCAEKEKWSAVHFARMIFVSKRANSFQANLPLRVDCYNQFGAEVRLKLTPI